MAYLKYFTTSLTLGKCTDILCLAAFGRKVCSQWINVCQTCQVKQLSIDKTGAYQTWKEICQYTHVKNHAKLHNWFNFQWFGDNDIHACHRNSKISLRLRQNWKSFASGFERIAHVSFDTFSPTPIYFRVKYMWLSFALMDKRCQSMAPRWHRLI